MSGEKIEQAKEALKFVLNNLREGDTFNIVAYDSDVESFGPGAAKIRRGDAQSGPGLCRRDLCRRQHEHRRRAEHGAWR